MPDETIIRIHFDDAGAIKSVEGLDRKLDGVQEHATGVGVSGSGGFLKLAGAVAVGTAALNAAGKALSFVKDQAVEAVQRTLALQNQIFDLSQKTGVAVEELSGWRVNADLAGVSLDSLAIGLRYASKNIVALSHDSGPAKDAFKALGIGAFDAAGNLKNADQIMLEVADRFSRMQDGAAKTAYTMAIFGRSGNNLIPMLNQGRDRLEALTEMAKRAGVVFDRETAAAADRLNDEMIILGYQFEGVQMKLTAGLMPSLRSAVGVMGEIAQGTNKASDSQHTFAKALNTPLLVLYKTLEVINDVGAGMADLQNRGLRMAQAMGTAMSVLPATAGMGGLLAQTAAANMVPGADIEAARKQARWWELQGVNLMRDVMYPGKTAAPPGGVLPPLPPSGGGAKPHFTTTPLYGAQLREVPFVNPATGKVEGTVMVGVGTAPRPLAISGGGTVQEPISKRFLMPSVDEQMKAITGGLNWEAIRGAVGRAALGSMPSAGENIQADFDRQMEAWERQQRLAAERHRFGLATIQAEGMGLDTGKLANFDQIRTMLPEMLSPMQALSAAGMDLNKVFANLSTKNAVQELEILAAKVAADPEKYETFADGMGKILGNLSDKFGVYQQAIRGAGEAWGLFITGQAAFAQAFSQAAASAIASISKESLVKAIYQTAEGFADLAWGDVPAATLHFTSAAKYGAVAGVSAVVARGMSGGAGGGVGERGGAFNPMYTRGNQDAGLYGGQTRQVIDISARMPAQSQSVAIMGELNRSVQGLRGEVARLQVEDGEVITRRAIERGGGVTRMMTYGDVGRLRNEVLGDNRI